jgi:hypothetical protein
MPIMLTSPLSMGIGDIDKMDRNVASRPEADIDRSQVMADDRAITT